MVDGHAESSRGDASYLPSSELGRRVGDSIFVWGIWTGLLLYLLAFIVNYGRRFPFCDDWDIILYLSGAKPLSLFWLWESGNEHRLPLPKLLFWAIYPRAGFDVRAATFCSTILMGVLCAGCLWTCRWLRRQTYETDAFFPFLILSSGHAFYTWAMHLHFVAVILISCTILFVILRSTPRLPAGRATLAGVCLCLLPLNGAQGLVIAPPLTLWLLISGLMTYRSAWPGGKRSGAIQIGLSCLSVVIVLLYFVGLRIGTTFIDTKMSSNLYYSFAFMNTYYFILTVSKSPWLGVPLPMVAGLATIGAVAGFLRDRRNRRRDLGMFCFALAVALLAWAVARGRGSHISVGAGHYAILTIPSLCWLYFAVQLYFPREAGRLLQLGLLCLTCAQFTIHLQHTERSKGATRIMEASIEEDLKSGVTPNQLATRHMWFFANEYCGVDTAAKKQQIISCLRSLRDNGIRPYSLLRADQEKAEGERSPRISAARKIVNNFGSSDFPVGSDTPMTQSCCGESGSQLARTEMREGGGGQGGGNWGLWSRPLVPKSQRAP